MSSSPKNSTCVLIETNWYKRPPWEGLSSTVLKTENVVMRSCNEMEVLMLVTDRTHVMWHLLAMSQIRLVSIKLVLCHLSSMHIESATSLKQTKGNLNRIKISISCV